MLKIYNFTKLRNCQLLNRQVVRVNESRDRYQIVLNEPSSEIIIDLYKDKLDSTHFTYKSGKGPNCYPMHARAFYNNSQTAERYYFLPANSMGSVNEFIELIDIVCKTGINELKGYKRC